MSTLRHTILQSDELFTERVYEQLKCREVDTGQYFGNEAFTHWEQCAKHGNIATFPDIVLPGEDATVIDLGPGTGVPCREVTKHWQQRKTILVDVSSQILSHAAELLNDVSPIETVQADFVRDATALRQMFDQEERKVVLCIGNTVANFRQKIVLPLLRDMLSEEEKVLIGVRLFQNDAAVQQLADFFASEANCIFGTAFLKEMGAKNTLEYNRSEVSLEEEGLRRIRSYHDFREHETLSIGGKSMKFAPGDSLRFVLSGCYRMHDVPMMLKKYGLEVLETATADSQGFFLCRRSSSSFQRVPAG